jgi:hypothetical protein
MTTVFGGVRFWAQSGHSLAAQADTIYEYALTETADFLGAPAADKRPQRRYLLLKRLVSLRVTRSNWPAESAVFV